MFWLIPAWVATVLTAYLLGYYIRGLTKRIVELEKVVQSKVDKKPEPEEPQSMVVDPLDEVQTAIYEHNKMMEKLNNGK